MSFASDYHNALKRLKKKDSLTVQESSNDDFATEYNKALTELEKLNVNTNRTDFGSFLNDNEEDEDIAPVKSGGGDFGATGASRSFGDGENGNFWSWLGDTAMSGLASFNKSITKTADIILGKPLQALGWEDNPISSVAEHYDKSYDYYKEKSKEETSKMGGGGYKVASDIVEGTVAALPDAILALMTMGASTAPSTANLATQAAYRTGNLLTKAGLTTTSMAKNPQFWLSFTRTYGNDYEEALEKMEEKENNKKAKAAFFGEEYEGESNTTKNEIIAAFTATITSLINAGIEIGIDGGSGFQGLPDKIKGGDKSAIRSWVESSLEEGGEEVLQGFVNDAVAKISYDPDREMLNPKEMATEFGMGAAVGGILGGGQIAVQSAVNAGANAVQKAEASKLTENEQKIVDKVYKDRVAEKEENGKLTQKEKSKIYDDVLNDMEKGYISTDTIESVLGGETYKSYQDTVDNEDALQKEFDTLNKMKQGEMTGEQIDRRTELKQQLEELKNNSKRDQLKQQLSDEVFGAVKDSRLVESYNEKARRGQAFEADLTKYDEKQRAVVQKAVESGILNNTNRTREFVDLVAKISADKGVLFDFTNNAKLKESGFAIDGKTVNGYVTKDGITVNMDSAKYVNSVVGHEITHVLEGTELYTELQKVLFDYAKSKNDYQGRYDSLTELYKGIEGANVDAELTADLVGDYLFTDSDFINRLSAENRNVFQKIYDEIKYLYKVATAGSKEARELEKVKRAFDKAYKAQKSTATEGGAKYSLNEFNDGQRFVSVETDQQLFDGLNVKDKTDLATKIIKGRFQGKVIGLDNKAFVNGKTADEFAHPVKHLDSDVYEAKMRASTELDNLMDAGFNFRNADDGADGHTHTDVIGGFDYFDVIFKVGTEYYQGVINIKNINRGKLLKDITKIRNITKDMTSRYGDNPSYAFLRDVSIDSKAQKGENVKRQYSLSDSDGKQLTAEQQEYFKDSKMRDENGNLKVMYHGSQDAGFHTFDANMSDDDTSFFFVDRNDVAASYSGTTETYEAKTIRTAEDMNNFLAEIGYDNYETVERDGKFELLENGEHVAYSDTARGIYEEFCWYEGVGEGDANYKVYLNLKNPLVIDAEGRNWNNISREFSQEIADRYRSLTTEEKDALADVAGWGEYGIFRDELLSVAKTVRDSGTTSLDDATAKLASAVEKLGGANANLYDAYSIATENFSEEAINQFAVKQMNTRDYAQKAKSEGYDGVIFNNIHDNGGYSNGSEGASTVAIAFESNQIKSVANEKPTANADIRFSLSESVEETDKLIAAHNLQSSELLKSIELGGLPMPSIAITKANEVHDQYGDVTLILRKDAIDPKKSKNNKVYGGDAWTPTYPSIEYKVNEKAQKSIREKINGLVPYDVQRALGFLALDHENMSNDLNRHNGDITRAYINNYAMQYAFLLDNGFAEELPMMTKHLDGSGRFDNRLIVDVVEKIGASEINRIANENINDDVIDKLRNIANENFKSKHAGDSKLLEALLKKPLYSESNFGFSQADSIIRAAYDYVQNGFEQTVDYSKARDVIKDAVDDSEYKKWLDNLFSDVVEKEGIRNDKDLFTPSGNRRSWEALHWENTLENVVRAMKAQDQTGADAFAPTTAMFAVAQKKYGSIDEIKSDSHRLGEVAEGDFEELKETYGNRLSEIANSIKSTNERNSFIAMDESAELIVDAVRNCKTKPAMLRYMQEYNSRVTEGTVDDIMALVNDIANMPTGYFEAKPRRAVGFEEVGVFVVPYNADTKLKQELLNRGYAIAEYNPEIEGDRQKVVNQFEEYKFSLSNVGETQKSYGNYNVSGKDLLLEQEIAPVAETNTVDENAVPDGFAPITEEEAEALREESFESLDDAEAPPEVDMPYDSLVDTITIDNKSLKQLSKNISDSLGLNRAGKQELERVLQDFSKDEYGTREKLYAEIERRFGTQYEAMRNNEVAGAKEYIRNTKINVSPTVKSEFGETKDYVNFMRSNFGKIKFSKDGLGVDEVYMELTEMYPELFSDDAINPADQLRRIAEVANTPISELIPTQLPQDVLQDATDMIYDSISEYKETERMIATEDMQNVANEHLEDFAPVGDVAPVESVTTTKGAEETTVQEEAKQPTEEKKSRRQELHDSILEDIKARFAEKGYDFDKVLKDAKNLSTFATVDNIPQRVMEKALGYKEGQILSDLTVNKVAQNETEGIKWLNSFTDRKDGLLAQLVSQYKIKPHSKESAAAQMYAEGFYVAENGDIVKYGDAELAKDFPDSNVRFNIKALANDPRIRQIYDDTLAMINESRTRNAYPEIPRLDNYFLHFRAMEDTFSRLGLPFNPNDIRAKDLPTDLNGVTADLKPGQPYFASAMHRTGKRTSFDLLGGLERYLTSAKNQIYHIDDIQTLRALRNYVADTYGQAKGLEDIDSLTEEEVQDRIEKVYGAHLSTFAKFLNEEANVLAGKTALIDRGLEGIIGRRGITFFDTLNKQVGSNMVGFNVSSSLTNFIPVAQTFAKTNKFDFVKAFAQTASNKIGSIFGRTDGFAENSPVIIRRKGADRFYRTPFQKVGDAGYVLMGAVDDISTELIARTKYNELTRKGMDSQQAHFETDKWVSRLMGDRSLGQMPQIYNSKMLGLFTKFQLEVRNQLDSQFYDTVQEAKVSNEDIQNGLARNAKTAAKVTATFVELAIVQHLFGKAFESVAGYNPAFDIIGVLIKALGFDDDEESEDTVLDNIEQGFLELLEDLPYTSTITGGGRIPISSALPIKELVTGEDQYGSEKSRWETLGEVAPYYVLPTGYGQIKKTAKGLDMFSEEHPISGSYTDSGGLRFPVDDTLGNRIQAGLFGQWSSKNARDYFDNEWAPLKEKQTQEFIDLELPIEEYRAIREGLSKFDKLKEKADYINSLDLQTWQKNLLINNIADRKESINMEDYGEYGSFDEFDFAEKNPEKYTFFKENGISYSDYASADEDSKRAYSWAYENQGKFTMSKAIADDFLTYYQYKSELDDIRADKDANGKTITGSGKEKKVEYINNLDLDYGQKIILLRSMYDSKADKEEYNADIVEYLNSRDDISYEQMVTILEELDFTVHSDGRVTW